ncbi:cytochrome c [Novosphingobium piscinae]|jgi:cytochrome c556|uniref:Cytochrome c n=1 Tax=Novosphingobium piscinae TaxID=1507448 RepID=A0A7X1FYC2_9SPHN|nr:MULTISPECIES: cytochrome c [Novosphingobium]MBC2669274.1 cytochrome c [Novosphingobium piscinae]MBS0474634.1 cytochrome c [Pseudomonadota bacterium]
MTRTAGRLTVALLLAVFILLALLLRTQGSASASAPAQLAPPDQREAVSLNPAQADHVLTEMRGLLASIRDIHSAMAVDDWGAVSAAAQAQGTGRGKRPPEGLRERQPPGFRQMSSSMRQQFDALNLAAAKGDRSAANAALGQALNTCVACHDSYRIEIAD